ncbi:MAG: SHOCT domain-containing protein [Candidatus Hodarchaeales archaeon]|jgi:hypothetical protein
MLNEVVKVSYRGFGLFILFILMFSLGLSGLIITIVGGVLLAFSWAPIAYPEILNYLDIGGSWIHITDPEIAFLILLFVGVILLGVGILLLITTFVIGKSALFLDDELSKLVDQAIPPLGVDPHSKKVEYYTPQRYYSLPRKTGVMPQLELLTDLRDRGVLSEEEFHHEKAQIMRRNE